MMKKFQTLFEDEDIIVVIKPAGILSQGDKSNSLDMVSLIKGQIVMQRKREGDKEEKVPYVSPVHRLDRGVRGLLVYAKSKRAAKGLSVQLQDGKFEKIYLCVLDRRERDELKIGEEEERLISYIKYEQGKNLSFFSEKKDGDKSVLDYRVLALTEDEALVRIRLLTGRKHQIRLQMTEISYGVHGDRKYNQKTSILKLSEREIALQCVSLGFFHPISGERMHFTTETNGVIFSKFDNRLRS